MALSVSKTFQFKPYEHLLCGTKELTTPKGKTYYLTVVMEVYSRLWRSRNMIVITYTR